MTATDRMRRPGEDLLGRRRRGAGPAGPHPLGRARRADWRSSAPPAPASRPCSRSSPDSTSRPPGRREVAGHDLLTMSTRERTRYRRHTVGFVWQQTSRNLLPYFTAAENVGDVARRRAHAAAHAGPPASPSCSTCSASASCATACPRRCRAASSSGSRSRSRSPTSRRCCSPTSRPASSTRPTRSSSSTRCARSISDLGVTVLIVTHDQDVSAQVRRTVQIRDGRLSTEVLRSTRTDEFGVEQHHAQEYAVLDKVGRLQLPQEYLTKLVAARPGAARAGDRPRAGAPDRAADEPRSDRAMIGDVVIRCEGLSRSYGSGENRGARAPRRDPRGARRRAASCCAGRRAPARRRCSTCSAGSTPRPRARSGSATAR